MRFVVAWPGPDYDICSPANLYASRDNETLIIFSYMSYLIDDIIATYTSQCGKCNVNHRDARFVFVVLIFNINSLRLASQFFFNYN